MKVKEKVANGVQPAYSRNWYRMLGETAAPEWFGVPVVKHPNDLWAYQQIIWETEPDLIVETGAFRGGSALYLASLFDLIGNGRVLSVDIATDRFLPDHERVEFLLGMSSTDPVVVSHVAKRCENRKVMVILDSAHNANHVYDELVAYAPLVSSGCYLVVEDTNRDGYSLAVGDIDGREGPAEAVKRFQPVNNGFTVDRRFEKWGFSQNPGGYLRKR